LLAALAVLLPGVAYATTKFMTQDSDGIDDGYVAAWGSSGGAMRYGAVTYTYQGNGNYNMDVAQVDYVNNSSPFYGTTLYFTNEFYLDALDWQTGEWVDVATDLYNTSVAPGHDSLLVWDMNFTAHWTGGLKCGAAGKLNGNPTWQAWVETVPF